MSRHHAARPETRHAVGACESNNWTRSHPVLDGRGALYQFAWEGTVAVIVRRPMSGESDVYYRSSAYDDSHAHQVMPDYLVTAQ